MQSLTHMAPATALLFTIQFTTSQAGIVAPLAYLVAFPIVLVLGVCLMQLARHLPSAGGYYTYISRTVDPRVGFLACVALFLVRSDAGRLHPRLYRLGAGTSFEGGVRRHFSLVALLVTGGIVRGVRNLQGHQGLSEMDGLSGNGRSGDRFGS